MDERVVNGSTRPQAQPGQPAGSTTGLLSAQHAAQSSTLPPAVDLSFLANYPPEQIAAIGQLFLSGAMQLPNTTTAPTAVPPCPEPQPAAALPEAIAVPLRAETSGEDLEDGEISEASGHNEAPAMASDLAAHVRAPVNGKRPRSLTPPTGPRSQRLLTPTFYARQQQQLEAFIQVMYNNGYGFEQVKTHVSNQDELSALYRKLSLPVRQHDQSPSVAHNTQSVAHSTVLPTQSNPRAIKTATTTQKTAITGSAQDRQSYLARLQAAKNKKTDALPASALAPEAVLAAKADQTTATAAPTRKGLGAEKSELLRQRLAALKAAQATKTQTEMRKVIDADQFLSNIVPRPPVDAVSTQAREPFDSDASIHQSLVISVSENEQSDSELDDASIRSGDGGVQLDWMQIPEAASMNGSHHSSLISGTSGAMTPGDETYEQKMQHLADLRRRLADLEQRKKLKLTGQHQVTTAINETVTDIKAAQNDLAAGSNMTKATAEQQHHLQSDEHSIHDVVSFPGLRTAQDTDYRPDVGDGSPVFNDNEDRGSDTEASDFEDVYGQGGPPSAQAQQTLAEEAGSELADNDDSDWTGTASDPDDAMPAARSVAQETSETRSAPPQTEPSTEYPEDTGSSSASDSASMDMSESDSEEMDVISDTFHPSEPLDDVHADVAYDPNPQPLTSFQQTEQDATLSQHNAPDRQVNKGSFVPYESPLKALKRYRFHPHLASNMTKAWQSTTWTHQNGSMNVLSAAENRALCRNHDDLPYHIHWEDYVLRDGEKLVDLAWNPGWDEEERQQWDFAMKSAAQEQSQYTDQSGSELTRLCEDIIAKHALTWSEQALVRNCQQLS